MNPMPRKKIEPDIEYSLTDLVRMRVLPLVGQSHAAYRLEFERQEKLGNKLTYQSLGSGKRTSYSFMGRDVLQFVQNLAK